MSNWRDNKNLNKMIEILSRENEEIIVFDLETTGLSRKCGIIEFAGIKYRINKGTLTEVQKVDTYINPGFSIPPKITEITGISDETVKDAPTEKEALEKIIYPFLGDSPILAGYNSSTFDIPVLTNFYQRGGKELTVKDELDVLKVSRDVFVNDKPENFKLGTLVTLKNLGDDLTFHNAYDDVRATARLFMVYYSEWKFNERAKAAEPETNKPLPIPSKASWWEGYRGRSRVYVKTNCGDFYYDVFLKRWGPSKSNIYDIEDVNFDDFHKILLDKYNVTDDSEFAKLIKVKKTA